MPLINNNKIKVKIKQIKHNLKNYLNIRNDIKKNTHENYNIF